MRAGRLNTRITIKSPSNTKDSKGRVVEGDGIEVATVWAEKRHVTGKERWANEHVTNELTASFRIRYREDIEPNMLVEHKGVDYQITGQPIDPDGRRTDLILTCVEYK
jgi:SPP1 family predicted phage head-tail adaptor